MELPTVGIKLRSDILASRSETELEASVIVLI